MRHRMQWILPALAALLLAGCSLAQPEAGRKGIGDRAVGFYVVREGDPATGMDFYQNPHLTTYGSDAVDAGAYGTLDIPREVLFAREEGDRWIFPGLEGWSLFLYTGTGEDGSPYVQCVSDMTPGEEGVQIKSTDEGTTHIISGVLYSGPPLGTENWSQWDTGTIWTMYRVYQTGDGRIYLDGTGNSVGGDGGFGYSESMEWTSWENGRTATDRIEASIKLEAVSRLEKVVVTQFDGENEALRADDLKLGEELPALDWEAGAAWALVEERRGDGVVRTAYTLPGPEEEDVTHRLIWLDEEGVGRPQELTIRS